MGNSVVVEQPWYLERVTHHTQMIWLALRFAFQQLSCRIEYSREAAMIEVEVVAELVDCLARDQAGRPHVVDFVPETHTDHDFSARQLCDARLRGRYTSIEVGVG